MPLAQLETGFQLLFSALNVLEVLGRGFSMDFGTCLVPVPTTSSGFLTWSLTPGHCSPGMCSRLLSSSEGFWGGKHGCEVDVHPRFFPLEIHWMR